MKEKIDTYTHLFEKEVLEHISKDQTDEEQKNIISNLWSDFSTDHAQALSETLIQNFSSEYLSQNQMDYLFETRNYDRWKAAFERISLLLDLSLQIGMCGKAEVGLNNKKEVFYRLQAAVYLHARGILVCREIFHLMKGGYPDAALGRWRTLHELAVINCFISQNSEEIAQRFFEARAISSKKAADQYLTYQVTANLTPLDKDEIEKINAEYERVINSFGTGMKNDYGWASPAFSFDNPTLFHLEKTMELDHWRPRYKWACQDTHANFRPIGNTLAMTESGEDMLLVGQSNSGMTSPGQMLATSLGILTSPFLSLTLSADVIILSKTYQILLEDINQLFEVGADKKNHTDPASRAG